MNSIWIARDDDGCLYAYKTKPVRNSRRGCCESPKVADDWWDYHDMDISWFPELTWESEPIELVIKEKED